MSVHVLPSAASINMLHQPDSCNQARFLTERLVESEFLHESTNENSIGQLDNDTTNLPEIDEELATRLYARSVSKSKKLIEALRSSALSEQAIWEKKLAEKEKAVK
jgi:hypothetical protein